MRNQPLGAVVYGIDLGKTRFDVVGCDVAGQPIQRVKFSRDTILAFFAAAPKALIGMEACPGAQWMARKLSELGHTVRIIPAQFVKPFVKSNKNDVRDAETIAEAVIRPTMRFVEIKPCEQIDLQALHRVRDRIVGNRTQLICQMRAFCLEYGIAIRPGTGAFKLDIARVITDETNDLTLAIRGFSRSFGRSSKSPISDLQPFPDRLKYSQQSMTPPSAHDDPRDRADRRDGSDCRGRRRPTISESAGSRRLARSGASTELYRGQNDIAGISKRGNPYIRRLLIHGARSCMIHLDRSRDRIGMWLKALDGRMHRNKAIVALANKSLESRGPCFAPAHPLRTDRAGTCLSITFVRLRGPRTDVGTVDRRVVSPVKKSSSLCSYHLLGTMRAHLIMAWLQQQPTRERPDTFTQAASDSRTKDLATPGRTIHFLRRSP